MTCMINISLPLAVQIGKKKYRINLNNYRNWHYIVSNKIKQEYKRLIAPQLEGLKFDKVELHFTLYKASKRKLDRANVLCISEKFASDALVECGVIEDDNDQFVKSTHYYTGGIDKENPRVILTIKPINHD